MNFQFADLKKFSLRKIIIVKGNSYASIPYTNIPGEL
jgi:hypothetical protein